MNTKSESHRGVLWDAGPETDWRLAAPAAREDLLRPTLTARDLRRQEDDANFARLQRWRRAWFFAVGRRPDILAHATQKRWGLDFPLDGHWPTFDQLAKRHGEQASRPGARKLTLVRRWPGSGPEAA
jgi:hypothetical protein